MSELHRHDAAIVLHDLGRTLHLPAAMGVVSAVVAFAVEPWLPASGYLVMAGLAAAVGWGLRRVFPGSETPRGMSHGLATTVAAWTLVPLFGAIPFLWIGHWGGAMPAETVDAVPRGLAAFFESYSGFTGTGLTMVDRPSRLPASLQWWRSLMQWVGGLGVVVVVLMTMAAGPGLSGLWLFRSEGREETIEPDVAGTVRAMGWIYVLYTGLAIAGLALAGAPAWEAVNHGLTAISNGGFAITDESMRASSVPVRLVVLAAMLTGGISFVSHARILRGDLGELRRNSEHHLLALIVVLGGAVVLLERHVAGGTAAADERLDVVFNWVSAVVTGGFQATDLGGWSATLKLWMVLAMVMGAETGATVGGLKLRRVIALSTVLGRRIGRLRRTPSEVVPSAPRGEPIREGQSQTALRAAATLAGLWVIGLAVGTMVLLHVVQEGTPLEDVLFDVASAQGNVGLSTGVASPELHPVGRLMLIVNMVLGRLEILPALMVLAAMLPAIGRRPA